MMQIFNGTVRLGGQLIHEVNRRGLTVPEIAVLQRIHGKDAVINLEHVGYAEVDPLDERERLSYEYDIGLQGLHEDQKTSIEKMFGSDYAPLPTELRGYEGELVDVEDSLANFQKPVPYASPNAEDRGAQIRRKAAEKVEAKKTKIIPPVKSATSKKSSSALDAVM